MATLLYPSGCDSNLKGTMFIRFSLIDRVFSDTNSGYLITRDLLEELGSVCKVDLEEIISRCVPLELSEGENLVGKAIVVRSNGTLGSVWTIGVSDDDIRFLESDEKTFLEFVDGHEDKCILGEGETFSQEVYDTIFIEYLTTLGLDVE